jgi:integrase
MPLKLYLRPSGVYHCRGTHHKVRVDRSTQTRIRAQAEQVREKWEREIFEAKIQGKTPERSFADAALGYMRGGGERLYLTPIIAALGDMPMSTVTQDVIDTLALELFPAAAPSTRLRKVYTPISAVMNWGADAWGLARRRIRRPSPPPGRIDWRTPAEIEAWLAEAEHLAPLLTFIVGTGLRASEAIELDWQNVSPAAQRLQLWAPDTKARVTRHVDLQPRVRACLPQRCEGRVWRNLAGKPWHGYDAVNLWLRRAAARKGLPPIHLHVLRHTWATWTYAVTKDLTLLMAQGGWASVDLAMRYVHAGTDDLAEEVLKHGWYGTNQSRTSQESPKLDSTFLSRSDKKRQVLGGGFPGKTKGKRGAVGED